MFAASEQDILNNPETEAHRQSYNAAFEELGLSWHWDPVTYACLPAQGADGLRAYLEKEHAHLLRAYEADFLVNAIETAKRRCYEVMVRNQAGRRTYARHAANTSMAAAA
jgi:hypothetical protein